MFTVYTAMSLILDWIKGDFWSLVEGSALLSAILVWRQFCQSVEYVGYTCIMCERDYISNCYYS